MPQKYDLGKSKSRQKDRFPNRNENPAAGDGLGGIRIVSRSPFTTHISSEQCVTETSKPTVGKFEFHPKSKIDEEIITIVYEPLI